MPRSRRLAGLIHASGPHQGAQMFKFPGALLAAYVCYCIFTGRVVAKSGLGAREVLREEAPGYFWTIIVIYAGLGIALMTVF
jgi:hypothetical protein